MILILFSIQTSAQNINAKIDIISVIGKVISVEEQKFETNENALQWSKAILQTQWDNGFLLAKLIETSKDSNFVHWQINQGDAIYISKITLGFINKKWRGRLQRVFSTEDYAISEGNVSSQLANALALFENNGYPFAKVWLDSFSVKSGAITAKLKFDLGPYFEFETIEIDPLIKVNPVFLMRYLNLNKGTPFNYKKIDEITNAISSLPYLKMRDVPYVSFSDEGKVRVVLDLDNVQVSSFDGIVGVAPNSTPENKTLFTGQFDFRLRNPFARGTSFDMVFEKFQENSQKLESGFQFPFMLSTPLGIDAKFNLLRVDTTYLNLNTKVGIDYYFTGNSKLSIYFNRFRAYPLSQIESNLLTYKNLTTTNYGLGYSISKLDYLPNPLKGISTLIDLRAGTKTEIIDQNQLNSTIFAAHYKANVFLPIAPKATIQLKNVGQLTIDSTFNKGQVLWVGGLKSIRGFNEGELPVKNYLLQTIEVRYLTDKNSHAKLFYDIALLNQFTENQIESKWYQGFGLGFNFKTGPGIFTINYAVGKTPENSLSLTNGKVHFGFLSYF
ncbi:MAG: hypothetical protein ACPGLV_12505 [Bacteroidia bacterium]